MVENRIKEYREALGWSQEQLARKSGVSRSTIGGVETGAHMPTIEVVLRLAEALETPIEKLFSLVK